jgi:hypothetical protein
VVTKEQYPVTKEFKIEGTDLSYSEWVESVVIHYVRKRWAGQGQSIDTYATSIVNMEDADEAFQAIVKTQINKTTLFFSIKYERKTDTTMTVVYEPADVLVETTKPQLRSIQVVL